MHIETQSLESTFSPHSTQSHFGTQTDPFRSVKNSQVIGWMRKLSS